MEINGDRFLGIANGLHNVVLSGQMENTIWLAYSDRRLDRGAIRYFASHLAFAFQFAGKPKDLMAAFPEAASKPRADEAVHAGDEISFRHGSG